MERKTYNADEAASIILQMKDDDLQQDDEESSKENDDSAVQNDVDLDSCEDPSSKSEVISSSDEDFPRVVAGAIPRRGKAKVRGGMAGRGRGLRTRGGKKQQQCVDIFLRLFQLISAK